MMPRLYIDTSALVPVYVPERFSVPAERALQRASSRLLSSLCITEFASAVSLKQRERELTAQDAQRVWQTLCGHIESKLFHVLDIEAADWKRASELAWSLNVRVRTLDAIHLSVVERMKATLVSADERQIVAARELDLSVLDVRLSGS